MNSTTTYLSRFVAATFLLALLTACATATPPAPTAVRVTPTAPATTTPRPTATLTPTATHPAPTATRTSRPTITPTPTETPITSQFNIAWNVPAIFMGYAYFDFAKWHGNLVEIVESDGYSNIFDIYSGKPVKPTPYPIQTVNPTLQANIELNSPDNKFILECAPNTVRLMRQQDSVMIGEMEQESGLNFCGAASWSPSSAQIVIPVETGIYLWDVTEPQPKFLPDVPEAEILWAPDGARFAAMYISDPSVKLTIFQASGQTLLAPVETGWQSTLVRWVSPIVLVINYHCGSPCWWDEYIDVKTGKSVGVDNHTETFDQFVSISPNNQWAVFDSGNYHIVNLLDASSFTLAQQDTTYIEFDPWSADSNTFYFVSRPVSATAKPYPQTPFGLHAFNPQTKQSTLLLPQAYSAVFSPNERYAFVVIPARHADGNLGMDGGIFDIATQQLLTRTPLADNVIYQNPANGLLVPVAWSADNTQVAFMDGYGNLKRVTIQGAEQVLGTNLPQLESDSDPWQKQPYHLSLSPDGQHVLVHLYSEAWLLTLPK